MIWLDKTKRWIIAHKNWLVLMVLFILSYLLGKKDNTAKSKAKKVKKALQEEKQKRLQDLENKKANIDDVFQDMGIDKK